MNNTKTLVEGKENLQNDTNNEDIFDLSRLRLSQNFSQTLGVKKALLTVPVRKPDKQEFVRTHQNEEYWFQTAVIELQEERRETYLVDSSLWSAIHGEIIPKVLITTINRQGILTLWPIRLPGEDGRHNQWHKSALEAALLAKTKWVRIMANMSLGAYDVYEAPEGISEPEWPDITFQEIIRIAFKDSYIQDLDHPVLKRLRGEI